MKARLIAVLLSLIAATVSVYADPTPKEQNPIPMTAPNPNKIDLNHADLSTLTGSFKSVGKKRAEAIIAYRESHEGFKSIEELADVKGLGQHFVDANREKLNEVYVVSKLSDK